MCEQTGKKHLLLLVSLSGMAMHDVVDVREGGHGPAQHMVQHALHVVSPTCMCEQTGKKQLLLFLVVFFPFSAWPCAMLGTSRRGHGPTQHLVQHALHALHVVSPILRVREQRLLFELVQEPSAPKITIATGPCER